MSDFEADKARMKAEMEDMVGRDAAAFLMLCMGQNRMPQTPEQFDHALLDLDDDKIRLRRYMAIMANHLMRATLVGNPAPIAKRMSERLRHPLVGDFVYEQSAIWNPDLDKQARGTGILQKVLLHPELTYQIQYGPDPEDVTDWTNASIYVMPIDPLFVAPVGRRDGTGVIYERNELIAAMADQGWKIPK